MTLKYLAQKENCHLSPQILSQCRQIKTDQLTEVYTGHAHYLADHNGPGQRLMGWARSFSPHKTVNVLTITLKE